MDAFRKGAVRERERIVAAKHKEESRKKRREHGKGTTERISNEI